MTALGRALKRRGHRVTAVGVLDAEEAIRAQGLGFEAIGQSDFPLGTVPQAAARLGSLSGLAAGRYGLTDTIRREALICRDAPMALRAIGASAVLVDQAEPAGGSVAELLGLPFITICNALALNREPRVPPGYLPWGYRIDRWGLLRNKAGNALANLLVARLTTLINGYRRAWGLPIGQSDDDFLSPLAQISQQPAGFDFPRQSLPACFHYIGPFRVGTSEEIPFPYERLTGQPIIYASLGTLQNRLARVFRIIAAACAGLDLQLVLSLGGGGNVGDYCDLPGSPLVVGYAPQLTLLSRACLTITHAGLNTVLESLANGVPMVAIPIANDQPGVAARVAWTSTGVMVPSSRLSHVRLRAAIRTVLSDSVYLDRANHFREEIRAAGGVERAADIVEQVITTGQPVLRGVGDPPSAPSTRSA